MWFRIERDKNGVKSCTEVESKLPGEGRWITYVDADNKTQALEIAAARWESFKRKRSDYQAKHVQRKTEKGLCIACARPASPGILHCEYHRAKMNAHTQSVRNQLGVNGRSDRFIVKIPKITLTSAQIRNVRSELQYARYYLKQYDKAPVKFRKWLLASIQRLENKLEAA